MAEYTLLVVAASYWRSWRDVAKSQLIINTLILFQQNRSFIARWPFVVPAHPIVLEGDFSDKSRALISSSLKLVDLA